MAAALAHERTWRGEGVKLAEVERALASLRFVEDEEGHKPDLRTSVLTHLAWVPPQWQQAAESVLEGLRERHPSRTIVLYPKSESERDAIDAEVAVEAFAVPGLERHIATEVIRLWLCDGRAGAPASVVLPLLISDLPVFLRWRGQPEFYAGPFEQLVEVADRLIVDSVEWEELPAAFGRLAEFFERIAVSDIAWARTEPWRFAIAGLWPGIEDVQKIAVAGPRAEALLLAGWLRAKLNPDLALEHRDRDELTGVALDGSEVERVDEEPKTPSDLLSDQLEIFGRDRTYEQAVTYAAK